MVHSHKECTLNSIIAKTNLSFSAEHLRFFVEVYLSRDHAKITTHQKKLKSENIKFASHMTIA